MTWPKSGKSPMNIWFTFGFTNDQKTSIGSTFETVINRTLAKNIYFSEEVYFEGKGNK